MQTFLQILGGCALLALVVIVVGVLLFRHRVKEFKKDVRGLKSTLRPGWEMIKPRPDAESREQPERRSGD